MAWIYVCDECDSSGVWRADFELMGFLLGAEILESEFLEIFSRQVEKIEDGKFLIPSFIGFQYGNLNPNNKAHLGIIKKIIKGTEGLRLESASRELVDSFKTLGSPSAAPQQTLVGGLQTPQEEEEEKEKVKRGGAGEKKSSAHPLVEIWNLNRGILPAVRGCSGTRMKQARSRWDENASPAYWAEIVQRLATSPFCTGTNDRAWKADFDFLIKPDTQHRVLEGKYDGKLSVQAQPGLTPEELDRLSDVGGVL